MQSFATISFRGGVLFRRPVARHVWQGLLPTNHSIANTFSRWFPESGPSLGEMAVKGVRSTTFMITFVGPMGTSQRPVATSFIIFLQLFSRNSWAIHPKRFFSKTILRDVHKLRRDLQ